LLQWSCIWKYPHEYSIAIGKMQKKEAEKKKIRLKAYKKLVGLSRAH